VYTLESALKLRRNRKLFQPLRNLNDPNNIGDIIQMLLAYAVQCEKKEAFVAQIMGLDPLIQQHLMLEVETGLKVCASINAVPPTPSPFKKDERENENQILRQQLDELKAHLAKTKHDMLGQEMEKMEHQLEVEHDLQSRIESKDKEIITLRASIQVMQPKLEKLQDEVEVLSAKGKDSDRKDSMILKLKEKLDVAAGVNAQVIALERLNADLLKRNTQAEETEMLLPKLRAELEQYKSACTACQFQVSEMRLLLEEKKEQVVMLKRECEQLEENQRISSREQVQEEEVALEERDLGISELNPQVRENLERLNRENAALKLQVSEQGDSHLQTLNFQVESLSNLRNKLEEELHESRKKVANLEQDLNASVAAKELADAQIEEFQQVNFDLEQVLDESRKKVADLEQELNAIVTAKEQADIRIEEMLHVNFDLGQVLDESRKKVANVEQDLNDIVMAKEQADIQIIELQQTLGEMRLKKDELKEETDIQIEELQQALDALRLQQDEAQARFESSLQTIEALNQEIQLAQVENQEISEQMSEYIEQHTVDNDQVERQQLAISHFEEQLVVAKSDLDFQLQEKERLIQVEQSLRISFESQLEHTQIEKSQLQDQVGQLQRQIKAIQLHRNQSVHRPVNESASEELREEISRLTNQIQQMRKESQASIAPMVSSGGVPEMIRDYHQQLEKLQGECATIGLSKTQELVKRNEIEQKYSKLQKENAELQAENTSFRLKIERLNVTKENIKPNVVKPLFEAKSIIEPRPLLEESITKDEKPECAQQ